MFDEMPITDTFKEWNHELVVNYPWLWTLRLPFLALYLAGTVLLLGITAIFPLKTYYVNHFNTWLLVLTIIELILFVLWMRLFNQFSPEKSLESTTPLNGMLEILIYMLVVLMFFAPTVASSYILDARYSNMISYIDIDHDYKVAQRDLSLFPRNLVETYSRLDYADYAALAGTQEIERPNQQIRKTILKLYSIIKYDHSYLINAAFILTHLSIFMFAFRHLRKGVLGKTFITALVLMVAISFASAITGGDFFDPLYFFRTGNYPEEIPFVIFLVLLSLVIVILALQVFAQKQYRTSTAICITLSPYVFYYWAVILATEYHGNTAIYKKYYDLLSDMIGNSSAESVVLLLLGTPLAILLVFTLVKAMYTRLLVLPEG